MRHTCRERPGDKNQEATVHIGQSIGTICISGQEPEACTFSSYRYRYERFVVATLVVRKVRWWVILKIYYKKSILSASELNDFVIVR